MHITSVVAEPENRISGSPDQILMECFGPSEPSLIRLVLLPASPGCCRTQPNPKHFEILRALFFSGLTASTLNGHGNLAGG